MQKDQSQKGIAKLASRRANCKVKPFGFLRKIFLSSLRSKRVFSPKNLACRSVYANSFAFLFSFFRFFFFPGQFVRRAAFSALQRVGTLPTCRTCAPCWFLRSGSVGWLVGIRRGPFGGGSARCRARQRKSRGFSSALSLNLRKLGNRLDRFFLRQIRVIFRGGFDRFVS